MLNDTFEVERNIASKLLENTLIEGQIWSKIVYLLQTLSAPGEEDHLKPHWFIKLLPRILNAVQKKSVEKGDKEAYSGL